MSPEAIDSLVEKTRILQAAQIKPDSPEVLEKLPSLDLTDIKRESERFPTEVKRGSSPEILFHDLFTNKIAYVQIGFDAMGVPPEKLQYLPLIGRLVLGMGTQRHSYMEISQLLGIHTGGLRSWHFTSALVDDHPENLEREMRLAETRSPGEFSITAPVIGDPLRPGPAGFAHQI